MNKLFKNSMVLFGLAGMLFLGSCKKDDPALPDNIVAFDSNALGTSAAETQATVTLTSLRSLSTASTVSISLELTGLVYGTHFTTEPAAVSNTITLSVPANTTSASILVKKVAGATFDGSEKIKFTIQTVANGLIVGTNSAVTLSFSEIISSGSDAKVLITGGGAFYTNKVFIDLSGNRITSVARTSWDLGFSSSDDFRVLLNSPNGMMAYVLAGKTDLSTVTAADTAAVQLGSKLSMAAVFAAITSPSVPAWTQNAYKWIDNPAGDLTKSAIAAVSATASENLVYIINRGDGPGTPATKLGWKKIRIIRNGSNYTLQHADIGSTNITSATITKDATYRFNYFSFTTGAVTVEPPAKKWDIAWNGFSNLTNFGYDVPYYFQDIIIQNPQVQTLQVLNSTIAYDAFADANLNGLVLLTSQINIGANWRSGGGPGTAPSIRTDRYYIIKDPDGNYYKLRFTDLTTDGERGKPQFQFKLVKKAA